DVTKHFAALKEAGFSVTMFSGDLSSRERRSAIHMIKENHYQIIVCSDLLSRGIDIEDVTDVVSVDLPSDLAYYHHRAGRTGRFGKKGDSWVFYNADGIRRPKMLMEEGIPFRFEILKAEGLVPDTVGLAPKKKLSKKKAFSEEEATEVKIAKARSRVDKVKPGYKKKTQRAVEKVKNKYRRKAIQKSVGKAKAKKYSESAKKASAK
ncbi:MAG: DEAD/DEAH box helicase, partial [Bacilli bacterium]|nr:DEAD/DEAH box helicase [Bacilli bacterium]